MWEAGGGESEAQSKRYVRGNGKVRGGQERRADPRTFLYFYYHMKRGLAARARFYPHLLKKGDSKFVYNELL